MDHLTFSKSYIVHIFSEEKLIYAAINNIYPDRNESDRVNFLNKRLDEIKQPPLSEYEIVYHKLTKGY
jgi:hypothetical protein